MTLSNHEIIKYFQLHGIRHILALSSPLIVCYAEKYRYFPKLQAIKINIYSHFHILPLSIIFLADYFKKYTDSP